MKQSKRDRLEAHGWKIGGTEDFLELSDAEMAYIEVKIALSNKLREQRLQKGLTQKALAALTGSSQSRVAKIEGGDPTVSIDLIVKMLVALGTSRDELARAIGTDAVSSAT